ncbi:hypothetical protein BpHYR1_038634 [Brachionus plicatilis]|uniref:Uncharacterized protein n=1 Tax=Brachionus plicatilis TaxID=10195 RepID=A0A3M7PSR2_BRAPC|nr:hypothetical protein BpHYR1_038634 [Brachionus plicatilis]
MAYVERIPFSRSPHPPQISLDPNQECITIKNGLIIRLTHSEIQEDMRNYIQNNQKKFNTPFDFFLKIAPITWGLYKIAYNEIAHYEIAN